MSHYIINTLLFVLPFLYFHSHALTLHSPTTHIAYGLYFNLTWTSGGEDPTAITITSTNLNTTKSFLLANVNVSSGNITTRIMPDTPASLSGIYSLQAVDASNSSRILDMIPAFNISTIPIFISIPKSKGRRSLGAIIGGVVGSLAFMALLVAGFLVHRRRHRRNRHLSIRLPDFDEHAPAQTQEEWEAQVHDAMAEAQRRSNKIGLKLNPRAHNRLESLTHTASVTSDDIYNNLDHTT